MTQKTIRKMLTTHIDILDHFIEQKDAWDIRCPKNFDLVEENKWLNLNSDNTLSLNKNVKIPKELELAYWKLRFEETSKELNRLRDAIDRLNASC